MIPRVLVTRAADDAAPLLAALGRAGLAPVGVPAIEVLLEPAGGPLDAATRVVQRFDWVVVTSANGARAVLAAAKRVGASLEGPRWAAIGPATGGILEEQGIELDFRPSTSSGSALATQLPIRPGARLLLVRGDLADGETRRILERRGADVTDVVGYRTREAPPASRQLLRDAFGEGLPAAVVLTSGSTAAGLVALGAAVGIDVTTVPAVCIGPQTARAARGAGFEVLAVSPAASPAALAETTAAALALAPLEAR